MKRLSFYMLLAAFLSGLFYSASYPYIYAETVKAVTQGYISFESVFACLGSIVFCGLWNKYSDKLFRGYRIILWLEVLFDVILFADVLIRGDLKFYFVFNVIIYSIITKNLACGGMATDYDAVRKAFIELREYLVTDKLYRDDSQIPIGIPYKMGCELGGGDWDIYRKMLQELEDEYNFLFIVHVLG